MVSETDFLLPARDLKEHDFCLYFMIGLIVIAPMILEIKNCLSIISTGPFIHNICKKVENLNPPSPSHNHPNLL